MSEEVVVPFRPTRATVPPLVGVRSTLITSSLLSLRANGLEARYVEGLDPIGLRGLLTSVSEPFAQKVYVREIATSTTETSCGFRISWA